VGSFGFESGCCYLGSGDLSDGFAAVWLVVKPMSQEAMSAPSVYDIGALGIMLTEA